MAGELAVHALVIAVTTVAVYVGSGWLESASELLSNYYGLPLVVQGALVAAVGSSFPELASVVFAALFQDSLDLGVGAIVGSAIFNVLVIPAAAGIATDGHVQSSRALVFKEAQFYMLSISTLVITIALGVIYYPGGDGGLVGRLTRPLALIPLGLYCLYLFIQALDTADHDPDEATGADVDPLREWARLLAGLLVILVAVHYLVEHVSDVGTAFGVPSFIMGVTVLAGATSLPDSLVSVRAAKDDRGVASLANVLGSNTFDLLVAIPIGVLIVGEGEVDFAMAIPMFGVLTLATVLLFTALRTGLRLTQREAYALLATYGLFVLWVVGEALGIGIDLLPN